MFALLVETWADEPGSWADFPAIPAPALIICGENGEPDAAPPRPADGANTAARLGPGPYVYAARASANIRFCRGQVIFDWLISTR